MLLFLGAGTDRCDVKTSISRSLGLHLGVLGEHFGIIWQLLGLSWGPLGAFWRRGRILTHFPPKVEVIWGTLLAPKISKVAKKLKETVPQKQCGKNAFPEFSRNGQKWDPYCKYNMF